MKWMGGGVDEMDRWMSSGVDGVDRWMSGGVDGRLCSLVRQ